MYLARLMGLREERSSRMRGCRSRLSHLRDRDRADSGSKRPSVRATRAHDDRRGQPFVARDATYSVLPTVIASRAFHMKIRVSQFFAMIHGEHLVLSGLASSDRP